MLSALLAHPLTRGANLDAPATTALRRRIILEKPLLRHIYEEWYAFIATNLPPGPGQVIELGAGGGFMRQVVPGCLASDVIPVPGLDLVCDGCRLPVPDGSLRAVVMTDVFHHLPKVDLFLAEMNRCVRPGGAVVMVEPWVTPWSRFVFGRLHHEPFLPDAAQWHFATSGPLSGANGALPWIVLCRDRERFEALCPEWDLAPPQLMLPLRYLFSGGVSLRSLLPAASEPLLLAAERLLAPLLPQIGLFAGLVLRRRSRKTNGALCAS